ncbi:hypothetical protein ACH5RR_023138 [Cinchona calisaya]|uniref:Uncharacterized protein n=1 Tax=Cinchona calisaya TaxID=153742 RepID=A0ABD2ZBP0_9GENT
MKGSEGPPAATVAERTEEKEEKAFPVASHFGRGWKIRWPAAMISLLNSLMLVQAGGHMGLDINLQTRTAGFQSLGVYHSLKKLMRHEGVKGFYKGNGASVLRIVPYAALHFMTYEQYRCWILDNYSAFGTGPIVDLLAGSAAGGTAVLCTYPLDLARTELAYQVVDPRQSLQNSVGHIYPQPAYTGIRNVIQSVYTEGGVRALYRGVGPTLIGILPYAGLKFYIYEELKRHVPEEHQTSIMMRLYCGALAGLS